MTGRVLITRPQPGTAHTAARLVERGFQPIQLPLTQIVPLPVGPRLDFGFCDAVAITSLNALRHAPHALIAALARTPCFAVGRETGHAARRAGFESVIDCDGTSDSLSTAILSNMPKGTSLFYLCGAIRTPLFENSMRQAGVTVFAVEVYDAAAIAYDGAALDAVVGSEPIHAVMLYSPRAADLYSACPWSHLARNLLAAAFHLCLSPRISERLTGIEADRIAIAEQPSDDSILRLLAERSRSPFHDGRV